MAREFRLPDIGEGLTEAEVVRWLVAVGETVAEDQAIVEVETDKAVVEIPSPYAGVVLRHGGTEGETIEVGQVLVVIGEPDELGRPGVPDEPADHAPAPEIHAPMPAAEALVATADSPPIVGSLSEEAESLTTATYQASDHQVKALPIVRKLARDHGIDLSTVRGSGPGGRISRQDIDALLAKAERVPEVSEAEPPTVGTVSPVVQPAPGMDEPTAAPAPAEAASTSAPAPSSADERRPMSRLRRTIAANMARSWAEIPHVTTFDDIDATRLLEVREALAERHGAKVPIEALLIKAVIPALAAYPEFNATIEGDDLVLHGSYEIGIAVDTPDGLMVAVIHDAGSRGVLDLSSEVRRLGEGARQRSLGVGEVTGQTFTVSNIGAVGGGHGTPIVPPGTTAILSVGRAKSRPMVYRDDIVIAPVMPLSLSYDHRVIDGALGRRFMTLLMENLEEPALFLAV
ncbi:MAG: dihydrolipoamide acetyltransferase family protein [Acidimicrobiia bacterium]